MTKENPYKDFEDWYTEVFGGHLTEEQANDSLKVAYNYYVDNRRLTVENAGLEAQIEKMKCCQNCEHKYYIDFRPVCHIKHNARIENPLICKCDKWEITEND